ncbi:NAD-dependent protein deacylase [Alkalibacterium putridalgicola]|uniref:NAD-dependent protein deacylase n=1 Tax=Alkalibacterium putridalgicola TaxID=426703 RepID=UPI0034CE8529
MDAIERVAKWFETGQKVVVITGAGVSTESGIPDFRSAEGLYSEDTEQGVPMEEVLSASFFNDHPKDFYRIYNEKLLFPDACPNTGHLFLKQLEDKGHEVTVITQNIDGLHQKAGNTRILELHGNASTVITESGSMTSLDEAVRHENELRVKGEWARPAITLYGEALDREVLQKSVQAVSEADILLVMGTSLNVYPAAGLIYDYKGDKSALINREGTPLNTAFSYVFHRPIGEWIEELQRYLIAE